MIGFHQYCKKIGLYPASRLEARVVFGLFLSLLILFVNYPNIDLSIARFFYDSEGLVFNNEQLTLIKHMISWISAVISIGVFLAVISTFFISWDIQAHKIYFLALVILTGPGLIVNTGFKSHWGRARPHQIMQFGGQAKYTMPFQRTDQCKKNCSFVSGHAAVGYSLILIGALMGRRWIWLIAGCAAGLMLGLFRMMQGGHFLSDVLFSFFPIWIAMVLVLRLFWSYHLLGNYFMKIAFFRKSRNYTG